MRQILNRGIFPVLACAAAALLVTATFAAQQEPMTVKQIMISLTIPSSDAIFAAAYETPASDEQWAAVRRGAVTLGESGKLLMTADHPGDEGWARMARALVDRSEAALEAADAKDGEALMLAGDDVYLTCENCHAQYMEGSSP